MKEIKAIVNAYEHLPDDIHAALATVVRVEGSSYRRTGARMLVLEDGTWIGGISGGCLEGDALKRARYAISSSSPIRVTYDTTDDDPHQIGVGLGCNGIIDVLFTPLNRSDKNNPVEILKKCVRASRKTHVLLNVTGLDGDWAGIATGDTIYYSGDETLSFLTSSAAKDELTSLISKQLIENHSAPFSLHDEDRRIDLFIEILPPEVSVILMGHQYDVYPMSRLLHELGWKITICGDTRKLNPAIRSYAHEIISPAALQSLVIDEFTAVVLMSHDYKTDKNNLMKILGTPAAFIGMLGPRVRSEKIWRELEHEGIAISAAAFERIHAPVGLDIGAVTPEEIALSAAAGIKAALAKRNGVFLKNRQSPIHPR